MSSIMRTWTGAIRTDDRDAYREYILRTGLDGYRSTPGNIDAWMLYRDRGDGTTEVVTVSLWESRDVISGFAGDDIDAARFYPEDDRYLVERDLTVKHYDVVG
jgi:heme-degrading monooxygenase HmoA